MLAGYRAYNAALKAGSLFEMRRLAEFAVRAQQLKIAVIGLDFFAFNALATVADDYDESVLAESTNPFSLLRHALSLSTLRAAQATVQWNMQGIARRCADNGYGKMYGDVQDTRLAFNAIQARYIANPAIYGDYTLSRSHLQDFEQILRLFVSHGVRVYPFISPKHATHMIVIAELGLLPQFEAWEREVTNIVDRVNKELNPAERIVLWDFAGFNSVTTERVPNEGDARAMLGYRDSSHYRSIIGDNMLARMFGNASANPIPSDFGTIVTSANVDEVLARNRRLAASYEKSEPAEVANSRRLVMEHRITGANN